MRWAVTVTTDGRRDNTGLPLLAHTWRSFREQVSAPPFRLVIADDSADPAHRAWLRRNFHDATLVTLSPKGGLSGAVEAVWRAATESWAPDWVFHLEDDWRFVRPVDLSWLAAAADGNELGQMALKRGPVNPVETAAGGFMQANPSQYVQHNGWVESSWGFTLNPCVIPGRVAAAGWRRGWGEREFSDANPDMRFGLWGTVDGDPHVEHIGHHRSGSWRL